MNATAILPCDDSPSFPSLPTQHGGDSNALGRIDHYDLLRKLGGGGFGVVYLAKDSHSGVEVALKTLHPLLKSNAEEMEILREKFALVSRLTHQNIAKALVLHRVASVNIWDETARADIRLSPGDSVMIMDYAPGVTLSKWRRQFPNGIVPLPLAVEIGRQIASALDYAHGEHIVHRDIKPANIMVEPQRDAHVRIRVLDFGLAAEIHSSMSRVSTEQGDTSGTLPYMAPEQWQGKRQDGRTDQYAFACVLYELLSGAVPFASAFETGNLAVMMTAVQNRAPDPVAGIPSSANAVLQRALAKDSANRFPSCTGFVEALSRVLHEGAPNGNLSKRRLLVPAAALVALVGLGAWLFPKRPTAVPANAQIEAEESANHEDKVAIAGARLLPNGTYTETVNGVEWRFSIKNGSATIGTEEDTAVPADTTGKIQIPNRLGGVPVDYMNSKAFYGCSGLTSITIPYGMTSISDEAFCGCSKLFSIEIPNTIMSIGVSAFWDCSALSSIQIPNSVEKINSDAFGNCVGLTSISIPTGVTSIGSGCFSGCSNLTTINIPTKVTSISVSAFDGCSRLTAIEVSEDNTRFLSQNGILYSKDEETLIRCPEGQKGVVTIPNTVVTIGEDAFKGCSELTSITIAEAVTNIVVRGIGSSSSGNFSFSTINVADTMSDTMTISDGSGYSYRSPFSGCSKLMTINVAEGNSMLSSQDGMLFSKNGASIIRCPEGKRGTVSIPDTVMTIGNEAFSGCSKLISITIPSSVSVIGDGAFSGCSGLSSIIIPKSVVKLGHDAQTGSSNPFGGCSSLVSIVVEDGNPRFTGEDGLLLSISEKSLICCPGGKVGIVEIPKWIERIEAGSFSGCEKLTSVIIPDSVIRVGSDAYFGMLVFDRGCSNLAKIVFEGSCPKGAKAVPLEDFDIPATIYVRRGSTGWGVAIPGILNGRPIRYLDDSP